MTWSGRPFGYTHRPETIEKMRKPKSPEHRAAIARARTGVKRSPETIEKMRASQKALKRTFSPAERERRSSRWRGRGNPAFGRTTAHGPRTRWSSYRGVKMRSPYEIRLATAFDSRGLRWVYEPERFDLGECTYLPDFYLPDEHVYWEAKGWFSPEDKRRVRLFRHLHPDKSLIVATDDVIQQWRISV